MKAPSARLFANAVTIRRATWTNVRGTRTPTFPGEGEAARASVQPAKPSRVPEHLRATGLVFYDVLFPSDPGLKADDRIEWDEVTLSALGPGSDQAGRGAMWLVTCREGE